MAHKGHPANKKETTQTKKKTRKQKRKHANKTETTQIKKKPRKQKRKRKQKKKKPPTQNRNHAHKTETTQTKQKPRTQNRNHANKKETRSQSPCGFLCCFADQSNRGWRECFPPSVVWSTVRGVFDEEFRRCSAHAGGQN